MSSVRMLAMLVWVVAAIFGTSIARGDAPCHAGIRASTPAERATMTAVLQAAKKALPPAPEGWQIISQEEISVVANMCRDSEKSPWSYHFSRSYGRVGDHEARQKVIADAGAVAAADFAKKKPRLDAIMARMTKLSGQQVALVQKGDMARATALNEEMAKLQAEYEKIADEGDSEVTITAAGKEANRDLDMGISVRINPTAESQGSNAVTFALPPGATAALRWNTSSKDLDQGHALVLFGKWNRTDKGRWNPVQRSNAVPTAAHAMSVSVIADPNRVDSMVQSIDFKNLAAALAK